MNLSQQCLSDVDNCQMVQRIINSLKSYRNMVNNNDAIISHFSQYPSFLDDYDHVLYCHDLEIIYNHISSEMQCEFETCPNVAAQAQRRSSEQKSNDTEITEVSFYKETIDQIHILLLHPFDSAFRIKRSMITSNDDIKQNDDEIEAYDDDQNYPIMIDNQFAKISKLLKKKGRNTDDHNKEKFKIAAPTNNKTDDNGDKTLIDLLGENIMNADDKQNMDELYEFLKLEEYDTDAIYIDMIGPNNICSFITNDDFEDYVKKYITNYRTIEQCAIFRNGIRWFYWKHFEHNMDPAQDVYSLNEHDRIMNYNELFVKPKYTNIMEEALQYLSYGQYKKCLIKAQKKIDTERARQLTSKEREKFLHYGINKGQQVTIMHLFSIILYTDNTDLCCEFSKSFRPLTWFEALLSIKRRNSSFAHWAKLLRECIEIYGTKMKETADRGEILYSGASVSLLMESYQIRLYSPTSTTISEEVAINFTESDGCIIELCEAETYRAEHLRYMNVKWLSRYPEEEERTFIGGQYPLQVRAVKIAAADGWLNYQIFCKALYRLDLSVNGAEPTPAITVATKKDNNIIKGLIQCKLNYCNTIYPDYVYNSFQFFTERRQLIAIDMVAMNLYFAPIQSILFENGLLNLTRICSLYPNVEKIKIFGVTDYPFDLFKMTAVAKDMFHSKRNKLSNITIIARRSNNGKQTAVTWLYNSYKNIQKNNDIDLTKLQIVHETDDYLDIVSIKCV